jgi:anti-anti-sigma factor
MPVMERSILAPAAAGEVLKPMPAGGLRRIEDWLVTQLEGEREASPAESLAAWRLDRRDPADAARRPRRGAKATSQSVRLGLVRSGDVTIVRMVVANLLKEEIQDDTAEQLDALLSAGAGRIVVNFASVERLSSRFLNVILAAHERCLEQSGGQLRLCAIRAELRPLFEVTGLERTLAIFSDEAEALAAPWPGTGEPTPPPLSILAMLKRHEVEGDDGRMVERTTVINEAGSLADSAPRLRIESGRFSGMELSLDGGRLRIGRDRGCQVRCNAATVSRFHAEIERDDLGRLVLRDLDSTNGTTHNDVVLRGESAVLAIGDRVSVGPLRLQVEAGDEPAAEPLDQRIAGWLTGRAVDDDEGPEPGSMPLASENDEQVIARTEIHCAVGSIRHEVIEGVLVVTPRGLPLDEEPGVEALRAALQTYLETGQPRRVVVNLETAGTLSSRAIGLLLAHALRLDGLGGALRVAQPQPRARTWLEHLRIPLLIDLFATLDEAVIAAWG